MNFHFFGVFRSQFAHEWLTKPIMTMKHAFPILGLLLLAGSNLKAATGNDTWVGNTSVNVISGGAALSAQGFNEGKGKSFTAEDIRFATKGGVLYAIMSRRKQTPICNSCTASSAWRRKTPSGRLGSVLTPIT